MSDVINRNRRYDSVDSLRGLVIVLMGLDHIRDFFSPYPYGPDDLDFTSPVLFFTRWITHYCAPIFIFLAGMSVFFFEQKGHNKQQATHYLLTRGLWLIAIELTVINLSWGFRLSSAIFVQVIWIIGWSMIILAGLIHLRVTAIAVICGITVLGHNLFDVIRVEDLQHFAWLWSFLHESSWIPLNEQGLGIYVVYPLVPWFAVIGLGYCFAHWIMQKPEQFFQNCIRVGTVLIVGFVMLRLINVYGDPVSWQSHDRGALFTLLAFLKVSKYPPSLLYVLMTIGPGIILLGILHRYQHSGWGILKTFGRVPFFYYIVHIPLIHTIAVIYFSSFLEAPAPTGWQLDILAGGTYADFIPSGYEPSMMRFYVAWVAISILLFFLCRVYGRFKQGSKSWIFGYL